MLSTRRFAGLLMTGALLLATGCSSDDSSPSASASSSSSTTAGPAGATTSTTAPPAEPRLTPEGYGQLRLGLKLTQARRDGLVNGTRTGCELGGPGEVIGDILGVDGGAAYFNDGRLTGMSFDRGTTAEGIGVGSTLDEARRAYSANGFSLTVDDSTVEVFAVLLASVTRNAEDAYAFLVAPDTNRVESVWIPTARFCD